MSFLCLRLMTIMDCCRLSLVMEVPFVNTIGMLFALFIAKSGTTVTSVGLALLLSFVNSPYEVLDELLAALSHLIVLAPAQLAALHYC